MLNLEALPLLYDPSVSAPQKTLDFLAECGIDHKCTSGACLTSKASNDYRQLACGDTGAT